MLSVEKILYPTRDISKASNPRINRLLRVSVVQNSRSYFGQRVNGEHPTYDNETSSIICFVIMTCQISFAAWFRRRTCSNITILSATLIIIQTPITWAEINLMSHSIINERNLYIPQHLFVDWNQSTPFTKNHKCLLNQIIKNIQKDLSNRDKVHCRET